MRSLLLSSRALRALRVVLLFGLGLVLAVAVDVAPASAATHFGENGSEAEQLASPVGLAVDATGNIYVGDTQNSRLDKFDGSGNWQWASGLGVLDEAPEMQTCTSACLAGGQVGNADALVTDTGVAVDADPLSSSYGDVYVVDEEHSRVEKFDASGNFILMFGGGVNENGGDVCSAGEKCKLYAAVGSENGEFSYMPSYGFNSFIGVGPGGAVYVGDKARVEVFEPSGAWKENISLAGLSSEARPTALAVDGSGDVFVKDAEVPGVHELESNGIEKSVKFDENSASVTAITLDSSGHVFVGDSNGEFHVLEYDASGRDLASFARKTVTGQNGGLAFSTATGEVYASEAHVNYGETLQSSIWAIPLPPAGPVVDSESATPELRGAATLEALVDPEGSETTVHFEYVDDAQFKASGYASATSTTPVSIGSGFEDQPASAHPTLTPGAIYHYRLVASSAQGTTTGEDESFQETPPALIYGPTAADATSTSVTIDAAINPLGASTTYRLEYGSSGSYGHVSVGSVGEGMGEVAISRHIQGLEPATTYHYRVVAINEVGTWASVDHTFTTQAAGRGQALPDGRTWELVSPANKLGARIQPEPGVAGTPLQAAGDGSGLVYTASRVIGEGPQQAGFAINPTLSVRGVDRWHSRAIGVARKLSDREDETKPPTLVGAEPEIFSSDLSSAVIEPGGEFTEPLSPEATERTLYLRDSSTGAYLPLVTPANVPSGTKFGGEIIGGNAPHTYSPQVMKFISATPDLSHIVFSTPLRLTPEAFEDSVGGNCGFGAARGGCPMNLYEWSDGKLALVDILPNGEPLKGEGSRGAYLGRGGYDQVHAISNDGSRVAWSHGTPEGENLYPLYVRDLTRKETWQVGGLAPRYETMSGNGARVFFWEGHELYVFDVNRDTTTDITSNHAASEHNAGVKDGFVMAASEDGTYVYYVATGVLAPGAVGGEDNLYVSHYNGQEWTTTLIATIAKADEPAKLIDSFYRKMVHWEFNYARVSSNGRYLAFMSSRALTGYDNTDVSEEETEDDVDGQVVKTRVHRDEEVYLYDAVAGRLACASCDPTGARPSGRYESAEGELMINYAGGWANHWLAADLPGWWERPGEEAVQPAVYQPRYLSDSGRLFFNSVDSLMPQDTNGLADVYEHEPAGVGGCTSASATFNEHSGGCVNLLSSGVSGEESAFMDASESGDDAFFVTAGKLVAEDYDTGMDVYDAHVCSAAVPCRMAPVAPPACTSGDSCKAAPALQPEIFGPAPSATFSGVGNVVEKATSLAKRSHARKRKRRVRHKRHHRGRPHERQARKAKRRGM